MLRRSSKQSFPSSADGEGMVVFNAVKNATNDLYLFADEKKMSILPTHLNG